MSMTVPLPASRCSHYLVYQSLTTECAMLNCLLDILPLLSSGLITQGE